MDRGLTWEWLAGFFDGEGSITLYFEKRGKYAFLRTQFEIAQKEKKILEEIRQFLKERGIQSNVQFMKGKRAWKLQAKGHKKMLRFFQYIEPMIRTKKILNEIKEAREVLARYKKSRKYEYKKTY